LRREVGLLGVWEEHANGFTWGWVLRGRVRACAGRNNTLRIPQPTILPPSLLSRPRPDPRLPPSLPLPPKPQHCWCPVPALRPQFPAVFKRLGELAELVGAQGLVVQGIGLGGGFRVGLRVGVQGLGLVGGVQGLRLRVGVHGLGLGVELGWGAGFVVGWSWWVCL
jgi:hypothetical protein